MKKAIIGQKILKIFDYFKVAFKLNTENKQLYKPQIFYLILRGVLLLLTGLSLLEISQSLFPFIGSVSATKFLSLFWNAFKGTPLLLVITSLLVLIFGSTYVEAGLYAMYDQINRGDTEDMVFASGANRYFFSFLLGNILIALIWIFLLVPYVIVGALTLTLGFVWVPIIINALLMVWKASIVTDKVGTIEAMSRSLSFGKRHFIPANVFIILQTALTKASGSGGSGSSNTSNLQNSFNTGNNSMESMPFQAPDLDPLTSFNQLFNQGFISTAITVGAVLISLISVIVGMIQMIFEIFFGLTTLIIYQDDWTVELTQETQPLTPETPQVMEVE